MNAWNKIVWCLSDYGTNIAPYWPRVKIQIQEQQQPNKLFLNEESSFLTFANLVLLHVSMNPESCLLHATERTLIPARVENDVRKGWEKEMWDASPLNIQL